MRAARGNNDLGYCGRYAGPLLPANLSAFRRRRDECVEPPGLREFSTDGRIEFVASGTLMEIVIKIGEPFAVAWIEKNVSALEQLRGHERLNYRRATGRIINQK